MGSGSLSENLQQNFPLYCVLSWSRAEPRACHCVLRKVLTYRPRRRHSAQACRPSDVRRGVSQSCTLLSVACSNRRCPQVCTRQVRELHKYQSYVTDKKDCMKVCHPCHRDRYSSQVYSKVPETSHPEICHVDPQMDKLAHDGALNEGRAVTDHKDLTNKMH